jgi:hypothetical protein
MCIDIMMLLLTGMFRMNRITYPPYTHLLNSDERATENRHESISRIDTPRIHVLWATPGILYIALEPRIYRVSQSSPVITVKSHIKQESNANLSDSVVANPEIGQSQTLHNKKIETNRRGNGNERWSYRMSHILPPLCFHSSTDPRT